MSLSPYHIYHHLCQAYFQKQFQLPGVHPFPGLVRECLHGIQDLPNLHQALVTVYPDGDSQGFVELYRWLATEGGRTTAFNLDVL